MNEERLKLRQFIYVWSDKEGLDQATALADTFRDLLPNRITRAQLSGLNNVVMAAPTLGQITAFTLNQASRALRAGRQDVKDYWDALCQALGRLKEEAAQVAKRAGIVSPLVAGKKESQAKAFDWVALLLAQEFIQHLVVHSLYLCALYELHRKRKTT